MKPMRNLFLSGFVIMFLLSGCATGGQSGQPGHSNQADPKSGQSPRNSTPLQEIGERTNNTKPGNDDPDGNNNTTNSKQTIDSIGFLEPAGVPKDSKIVNRVSGDLTYVAFFSYRVKSDGSLIPLKDQTALNTVQQSKAKPMLVITNFANGTFSPDIGHAILTSQKVENNLIENVVRVMKRKKYAALNVDFEHLKPEDRDRYTQFMKKLIPKVHAAGFPVSTSLAPKTSSKQTGSWYSAHDYGAHGKVADFVILMTYEWGWTGGPPMAVAPINQVKKVLDYAVTVIPHDKIIMGMPLYGYDWTLPYKKGGPPAKRLGFQEAAALAKKQGANIQYDSKSQAPNFRYTDDQGKKHVVWFENQKSLQAKFNLVKKYNLRGVSYWELGQPSPKNWALLKNNFQINQR
jgi:spore germination protein